MRLLIDAGNTRIKWALADRNRLVSTGALSHDEVAQLGTITAAAPECIRHAHCVSVASHDLTQHIQDTLSSAQLAVSWFSSGPYCCGVTNHYDNPAQLGADRWAAMVGGWSLHQSACLVVSAGTATTVDLIDDSGCFQGGLILPGEQLMRDALFKGTARLPLASGDYHDQPRNTSDAIISGCLNAQAGAIERMFRQLASSPGACCLLAGGNAGRIAPLLNIPFRQIDDLVLRGLAVAACASSEDQTNHSNHLAVSPVTTGES